MNEANKSILEYRLSDYSSIDKAQVFIGSNWEGIDKEKKQILLTACKIAEEAMAKKQECQEDITISDYQNLVVNINNRSRGSNNGLIDWNTEFVQGFVGALIVKDVQKGTIESSEGEKIDVKITIKSRFDNERPYFLSYLLSQVDSSMHNWYVGFSYDDIFDFLLVSLFIQNIRLAEKQGLYRTYQRFNKNNDRIKGSINIAEHVKMNIGNKNGKIAYSYREYTCDNTLNHLILYAYDHLKQKFQRNIRDAIFNDSSAGRFLDQMRIQAPSYVGSGFKRVIMKSLRPISHPYFGAYEKLRVLSLLIIHNKGVSIFGDEDEKVQGILHYVPDLWEQCVENMLLKNNPGNKLKIQQEVKVLGNNTYPDFLINSTDPQEEIVIDAKFKPSWFDAVIINGGKNREHRVVLNGRTQEGSSYYLWEDYNKCIRDMDASKLNHAGVLFPFSHNQLEKARDISALNKSEIENMCFHRKYHRSEMQKDYFHCYGICVPDTGDGSSVDYESWRSHFENILAAVSKNIINR